MEIKKFKLKESIDGNWYIYKQVEKSKLTFKGFKKYYVYEKMNLFLSIWKGNFFIGYFKNKKEGLKWIDDYKNHLIYKKRILKSIEVEL